MIFLATAEIATAILKHKATQEISLIFFVGQKDKKIDV
jgi:hypothetical protein